MMYLGDVFEIGLAVVEREAVFVVGLETLRAVHDQSMKIIEVLFTKRANFAESVIASP